MYRRTHIRSGTSRISREKCSKLRLKINWSLKTPLHMVFSILPNQPARNQWNYQEKMERHFSVETKFSIESSDPFTFRPKLWLLLSKVGLETTIFGNGTGSSVGPDRPVKEDHLWRWSTLTGKFPPGPNRFIYVWTEISGNFGIMESTYSLSTGVSRFGFEQHLDFIVKVVSKKK